MSDENIQKNIPTEATAVVELTADEAVAKVAAGCKEHQTRILNSFDQEAKNAAIAVIERYATTNTEGNVVLGARELDFETLAVKLARTSSFTFARVLDDVKRDAQRYCQNGFIAMVRLDVSGESWEAEAGSEEEQALALAPVVYFCDLPRTAPSFVKGKVEALAVYYIPTETYRNVVKYGWREGQIELVGSTRQREGFTAIARTFTDHDAAKEAASELGKARSTFHYQCRMELSGPLAKSGVERADAIQAAQDRAVRTASF
jgi:hypothetical protein